MNSDQTQISLKWYEIWWKVFIRPSVKTYSRIISDRKATLNWAIIWMAVTALIGWFIGPQRAWLLSSVENVFGLRARNYFYILGSFQAIILGVLSLMISAAIAHKIAFRFDGKGSFHQLAYCWAVMQMPFLLVAGLVMHLPFLFNFSHEFTFSTLGIIVQIAILVITVSVILYSAYSGVVALSAVENLSLGNAFVIMFLTGIILGIIGACLSFGFQIVVMNLVRS